MLSETAATSAGAGQVRHYRDDRGEEWEVIAGRASWGAFQLLFVPVRGGEVRQADLDAVSQAEAERALAALDEAGLAAMLEASRPREP